MVHGVLCLSDTVVPAIEAQSALPPTGEEPRVPQPITYSQRIDKQNGDQSGLHGLVSQSAYSGHTCTRLVWKNVSAGLSTLPAPS
jgi:hypothetical protein